MKYYTDLNNYIDSIIFISPNEYLLVSNLDLFYYLLNFGKKEINNWYNIVKEKKVIRYCMTHNNIELSHIIENNKSYLISWDKAKTNIPIYDLQQILLKYYDNLELNELIEEYEKSNKLNEDEYLLLLILLSIPEKIEFSNNTYLDTYNLSNYIVYLRKIGFIIQKYSSMKQKS